MNALKVAGIVLAGVVALNLLTAAVLIANDKAQANRA